MYGDIDSTSTSTEKSEIGKWKFNTNIPSSLSKINQNENKNYNDGKNIFKKDATVACYSKSKTNKSFDETCSLLTVKDNNNTGNHGNSFNSLYNPEQFIQALQTIVFTTDELLKTFCKCASSNKYNKKRIKIFHSENLNVSSSTPTERIHSILKLKHKLNGMTNSSSSKKQNRKRKKETITKHQVAHNLVRQEAQITMNTTSLKQDIYSIPSVRSNYIRIRHKTNYSGKLRHPSSLIWQPPNVPYMDRISICPPPPTYPSLSRKVLPPACFISSKNPTQPVCSASLPYSAALDYTKFQPTIVCPPITVSNTVSKKVCPKVVRPPPPVQPTLKGCIFHSTYPPILIIPPPPTTSPLFYPHCKISNRHERSSFDGWHNKSRPYSSNSSLKANANKKRIRQKMKFISCSYTYSQRKISTTDEIPPICSHPEPIRPQLAPICPKRQKITKTKKSSISPQTFYNKYCKCISKSTTSIITSPSIEQKSSPTTNDGEQYKCISDSKNKNDKKSKSGTCENISIFDKNMCKCSDEETSSLLTPSLSRKSSSVFDDYQCECIDNFTSSISSAPQQLTVSYVSPSTYNQLKCECRYDSTSSIYSTTKYASNSQNSSPIKSEFSKEIQADKVPPICTHPEPIRPQPAPICSKRQKITETKKSSISTQSFDNKYCKCISLPSSSIDSSDSIKSKSSSNIYDQEQCKCNSASTTSTISLSSIKNKSSPSSYDPGRGKSISGSKICMATSPSIEKKLSPSTYDAEQCKCISKSTTNIFTSPLIEQKSSPTTNDGEQYKCILDSKNKNDKKSKSGTCENISIFDKNMCKCSDEETSSLLTPSLSRKSSSVFDDYQCECIDNFTSSISSAPQQLTVSYVSPSTYNQFQCECRYDSTSSIYSTTKYASNPQNSSPIKSEFSKEIQADKVPPICTHPEPIRPQPAPICSERPKITETKKSSISTQSFDNKYCKCISLPSSSIVSSDSIKSKSSSNIYDQEQCKCNSASTTSIISLSIKNKSSPSAYDPGRSKSNSGSKICMATSPSIEKKLSPSTYDAEQCKCISKSTTNIFTSPLIEQKSSPTTNDGEQYKCILDSKNKNDKKSKSGTCENISIFDKNMCKCSDEETSSLLTPSLSRKSSSVFDGYQCECIDNFTSSISSAPQQLTVSYVSPSTYNQLKCECRYDSTSSIYSTTKYASNPQNSSPIKSEFSKEIQADKVPTICTHPEPIRPQPAPICSERPKITETKKSSISTQSFDNKYCKCISLPSSSIVSSDSIKSKSSSNIYDQEQCKCNSASTTSKISLSIKNKSSPSAYDPGRCKSNSGSKICMATSPSIEKKLSPSTYDAEQCKCISKSTTNIFTSPLIEQKSSPTTNDGEQYKCILDSKNKNDKKSKSGTCENISIFDKNMCKCSDEETSSLLTPSLSRKSSSVFDDYQCECIDNFTSSISSSPQQLTLSYVSPSTHNQFQCECRYDSTSSIYSTTKYASNPQNSSSIKSEFSKEIQADKVPPICTHPEPIRPQPAPICSERPKITETKKSSISTQSFDNKYCKCISSPSSSIISSDSIKSKSSSNIYDQEQCKCYSASTTSIISLSIKNKSNPSDYDPGRCKSNSGSKICMATSPSIEKKLSPSTYDAEQCKCISKSTTNIFTSPLIEQKSSPTTNDGEQYKCILDSKNKNDKKSKSGTCENISIFDKNMCKCSDEETSSLLTPSLSRKSSSVFDDYQCECIDNFTSSISSAPQQLTLSYVSPSTHNQFQCECRYDSTSSIYSTTKYASNPQNSSPIKSEFSKEIQADKVPPICTHPEPIRPQPAPICSERPKITETKKSSISTQSFDNKYCKCISLPSSSIDSSDSIKSKSSSNIYDQEQCKCNSASTTSIISLSSIKNKSSPSSYDPGRGKSITGSKICMATSPSIEKKLSPSTYDAEQCKCISKSTTNIFTSPLIEQKSSPTTNDGEQYKCILDSKNKNDKKSKSGTCENISIFDKNMCKCSDEETSSLLTPSLSRKSSSVFDDYQCECIDNFTSSISSAPQQLTVSCESPSTYNQLKCECRYDSTSSIYSTTKYASNPQNSSSIKSEFSKEIQADKVPTICTHPEPIRPQPAPICSERPKITETKKSSISTQSFDNKYCKCISLPSSSIDSSDSIKSKSSSNIYDQEQCKCNSASTTSIISLSSIKNKSSPSSYDPGRGKSISGSKICMATSPSIEKKLSPSTYDAEQCKCISKSTTNIFTSPLIEQKSSPTTNDGEQYKCILDSKNKNDKKSKSGTCENISIFDKNMCKCSDEETSSLLTPSLSRKSSSVFDDYQCECIDNFTSSISSAPQQLTVSCESPSTYNQLKCECRYDSTSSIYSTTKYASNPQNSSSIKSEFSKEIQADKVPTICTHPEPIRPQPAPICSERPKITETKKSSKSTQSFDNKYCKCISLPSSSIDSSDSIKSKSSSNIYDQEQCKCNSASTTSIISLSSIKNKSSPSSYDPGRGKSISESKICMATSPSLEKKLSPSTYDAEQCKCISKSTTNIFTSPLIEQKSSPTTNDGEQYKCILNSKNKNDKKSKSGTCENISIFDKNMCKCSDEETSSLLTPSLSRKSSSVFDDYQCECIDNFTSSISSAPQQLTVSCESPSTYNQLKCECRYDSTSSIYSTTKYASNPQNSSSIKSEFSKEIQADKVPTICTHPEPIRPQPAPICSERQKITETKKSSISTQSFDNKYCKCISLPSSSIDSSDSIKSKSSSNIYDQEQCKCNSASTTSIISLSSIKNKSSPSSYDPGRGKSISGSKICMATSPSIEKKLSPSTYDAEQCKCISKSTTNIFTSPLIEQKSSPTTNDGEQYKCILDSKNKNDKKSKSGTCENISIFDKNMCKCSDEETSSLLTPSLSRKSSSVFDDYQCECIDNFTSSISSAPQQLTLSYVSPSTHNQFQCECRYDSTSSIYSTTKYASNPQNSSPIKSEFSKEIQADKVPPICTHPEPIRPQPAPICSERPKITETKKSSISTQSFDNKYCKCISLPSSSIVSSDSIKTKSSSNIYDREQCKCNSASTTSIISLSSIKNKSSPSSYDPGRGKSISESKICMATSPSLEKKLSPSTYDAEQCKCISKSTTNIFTSPLIEQKSSPTTNDGEQYKCILNSKNKNDKKSKSGTCENISIFDKNMCKCSDEETSSLLTHSLSRKSSSVFDDYQCECIDNFTSSISSAPQQLTVSYVSPSTYNQLKCECRYDSTSSIYSTTKYASNPQNSSPIKSEFSKEIQADKVPPICTHPEPIRPQSATICSERPKITETKKSSISTQSFDNKYCKCISLPSSSIVSSDSIKSKSSSNIYDQEQCKCNSASTTSIISLSIKNKSSPSAYDPGRCKSNSGSKICMATSPSIEKKLSPSTYDAEQCKCISKSTTNIFTSPLIEQKSSPTTNDGEQYKCILDSKNKNDKKSKSGTCENISIFDKNMCKCSDEETSSLLTPSLSRKSSSVFDDYQCECIDNFTSSISSAPQQLTVSYVSPSTYNQFQCECRYDSTSSIYSTTKYASSPENSSPIKSEFSKEIQADKVRPICTHPEPIRPQPAPICSERPKITETKKSSISTQSFDNKYCKCISLPSSSIDSSDSIKSKSSSNIYDQEQCKCNSASTTSIISLSSIKNKSSPSSYDPGRCKCISRSTTSMATSPSIEKKLSPSTYDAEQCKCISKSTTNILTSPSIEQKSSPSSYDPGRCKCISGSTTCMATSPSIEKKLSPSTYDAEQCKCISKSTTNIFTSPLIEQKSSPSTYYREQCKCISDSTSCITSPSFKTSTTPEKFETTECTCSTLPSDSTKSSVTTKYTICSVCEIIGNECPCLTDTTYSKKCKNKTCSPSKYNTDNCCCSTIVTRCKTSSVILTNNTTSPCELTPEECKCKTDISISTICESKKVCTPGSYISKECWCCTIPTSEDISKVPYESTSECIENPVDCICDSDRTASSPCLGKDTPTPSKFNTDECYCSTLPTKPQSSSVVMTKYTTSPCELTPAECRCLTDSTLGTVCASHESPTPSSYISKECFSSITPTSENISKVPYESTSECIENSVDCICVSEWTKSSSCPTRPSRTPSTYNIDECYCSTLPTKPQSSSVVLTKYTTSPCELTPEECRCLTDSTLVTVCASHESPTPSSYISKECFCSTMPTSEDISKVPYESTSECIENPVDCICVSEWTESSSCLTRPSRTPSTYNIDECYCSSFPTKPQSSSVVLTKYTTSPCEQTPKECRCLTDSTLGTVCASHESPTPSSYISKECFCITMPTSEDISKVPYESTSECIENPVDCICVSDWTKSSSCPTRPSRTPSTYNIDECYCSSFPTKPQSSSVVLTKYTTSPCELTPAECRCLTDSTLGTVCASHESPTPSSYISKECFCSTMPTSEDISKVPYESISECTETPVDCICVSDWTKSTSCLTRPSRTPSTYNIDECYCSTLLTKPQSSSVVLTKYTTSPCELTPAECRCLTDSTLGTVCASHESRTPSSYISKECFCSTMPTSEDISKGPLESTLECIETPVDCICVSDWTKSASCLSRPSRTPSTYNIDECYCSTLPTKPQSSSDVLTQYTTSPCEVTPAECRCLTDSTHGTVCASHGSPTPSTYISKECFCSTMPTSEDISKVPYKSTSECVENPVHCICVSDWTKSTSCLTRPSRTPSTFNIDECYCSNLPSKPQSSSVVLTKYTTSPCELTPEECRCLTDSTLGTVCASHESPTPSSYISTECFCSTMPTSEDISKVPYESTSECVENPVDYICVSDWTKSTSCLTRPSRTPSTFNIDECYCSNLPSKPQSSSVVLTKYTTSPCELTPEECRCLTDSTLGTVCASHESPTPSSYISKECFCSTMPTSEDISKLPYESTSECIETPVDCICVSEWTKSTSCLTRPSRTPSTYNIDECYCSTLPTKPQSSSVVLTKYTTSPCELTPAECRCLTDSTLGTVCASHESHTPSSYISKECFCSTMPTSEDISKGPLESTSECIETPVDCICVSDWTESASCLTRRSRTPSTYSIDECYCSTLPMKPQSSSVVLTKYTTSPCELTPEECRCLTDSTLGTVCASHESPTPSSYISKECFCSTMPTFEDISKGPLESTSECIENPVDCICVSDWTKSTSCLTRPSRTPSTYNMDECYCSTLPTKPQSSCVLTKYTTSPCELTPEECRCLTDSTLGTVCASHESPTPSSYISKECFCSTMPTSEDISKVPYESISECTETPVDCICVSEWTKSTSCLTRPSRTPSTYNIDECYCSTLPTKPQSSSVVLSKYTTSPRALTPEECRCLTDSTISTVCASNESHTPSSYISKECFCSTMPTSEDISKGPLESTSECFENPVDCICVSDWTKSSSCPTRPSRTPFTYNINECYCSTLPASSKTSSVVLSKYTTSPRALTPEECRCLTDSTIATVCASNESHTPSSYISKECFCSTMPTSEDISKGPLESTSECIETPVDCICVSDWTKSSSCPTRPSRTPSTYNIDECYCSTLSTSSKTSSVVLSKYTTSPRALTPEECRCLTDSTIATVCASNESHTPSSYISKECFCSTMPTSEDISKGPLESTSECIENPVDCICVSEWTKSSSCPTRPSRTPSTYNINECYCSTLPASSKTSSVVLSKYTTSPRALTPEECRCLTDSTIATVCASNESHTPSSYISKECFCSTMPTSEDISKGPLESTSECIETPVDCICVSEWTKSSSCPTRPSRTPSTYNINECYCSTLPASSKTSSVVLSKYTTSPRELTPEECRCLTDSTIATVCASNESHTPSSYISKECFCSTMPTSEDVSKGHLESTSECIETPVDCICVSDWTKSSSCPTRPSRTPSTYNIDECYCSTLPTSSKTSSVVLSKYTTSPRELTPEECRCLTDSTIATVCASNESHTPSSYISKECFCNTISKSEDLLTAPYVSTAECIASLAECVCKSESSVLLDCRTKISESPSSYMTNECHCFIVPSISFGSSKDSISSVSKCLSTVYNECICLTEQSSLTDCTGEKRTTPSEYETKTCICKTLFTTFASSIFTFDFDSIMCSYSYPNECECITEPISSKSCLSPKLETPPQYDKHECSCSFSRQGTSSHTFLTSTSPTCEINLYNCQCQSDSTKSESCSVSICTCKTEPTTTLKSTSKETVEDGECKCKSEILSVTTKTNSIISSDTFDYGTKCSCKTEPTTTLKSTSKKTVEDGECKCKSEILSVTTKTNSIISSDTVDFGTKCSCKTEPTTNLKSTSKETVEDGECKCKSEILSVTTKTNSIISSDTVDFGTKCSCKTEPTTNLKSTSKETVEDGECKCKSEILSVTTKTNSIISSDTVDYGTKCSCKTEPTTIPKSTRNLDDIVSNKSFNNVISNTSFRTKNVRKLKRKISLIHHDETFKSKSNNRIKDNDDFKQKSYEISKHKLSIINPVYLSSKKSMFTFFKKNENLSKNETKNSKSIIIVDKEKKSLRDFSKINLSKESVDGLIKSKSISQKAKLEFIKQKSNIKSESDTSTNSKIFRRGDKFKKLNKYNRINSFHKIDIKKNISKLNNTTIKVTMSTDSEYFDVINTTNFNSEASDEDNDPLSKKNLNSDNLKNSSNKDKSLLQQYEDWKKNSSACKELQKINEKLKNDNSNKNEIISYAKERDKIKEKINSHQNEDNDNLEELLDEIFCDLKRMNTSLKQEALNIYCGVPKKIPEKQPANNFNNNNLKCLLNDSTKIKPAVCPCENSYPVSIKSVTPLGKCSFFITWKIHSLEGVKGYEIYIDGCLKNRLHSTSYESAVIYGVSVNKRHVITLQAIGETLLELFEKNMRKKRECKTKDNWNLCPSICSNMLKMAQYSLVPEKRQWNPSIFIYVPGKGSNNEVIPSTSTNN